MNIRIGVLHTAKELELEMSADTEPAELRDRIDKALAAGDGVLWLTDKRHREVAVPVARIAYVDLTPKPSAGRIGFGS